MSAPALVLRVTGLNAMVGVIYDFIGRPLNEGEERDEPTIKPPAPGGEAASAKNSDNTA